jgi:hypothetical protein
VNIYVASKFENKEAVREAMRELMADGHSITRDWTKEDDSGLEGTALKMYHQRCADDDIDGVIAANGFLLLHYPKVSGAASEFGAAVVKARMGLPMCIVVIDGHHPGHPRNIFFHLGAVHHAANIHEARALFQSYEVNVLRWTR